MAFGASEKNLFMQLERIRDVRYPSSPYTIRGILGVCHTRPVDLCT